jgi:hypothetical protein
MRRRVLPLACLLVVISAPSVLADRGHLSNPKLIVVRIPDPGGVVSAYGALWVQSGNRNALWKVSRTGQVLDRIPGVSKEPQLLFPGVGEGGLQAVGAGFGSIWSLIGRRVLRIDPVSGHVISAISVDGDAMCLSVGTGGVWVGNARARLIRIDPGTEAVSRSRGQFATPSAIATGAGHVWWLNISEATSISVFDAAGRRVVRNIQDPLRSFVVVARHEVWTADHDGSVSVLRTGSGRFAESHSVAPSIMGIAASRGTVWLNAGDLIGLEAASGRVVFRRHLAPPVDASAAVAQLGDMVWLSEPGEDRLVGVSVA